MSSPLSLDTFIVPYREIVPAAPRMSSHEPVFPAIAYSLISGERDAVLIDTPYLTQDLPKFIEWLRASGKNLTTIYITHGHGDHFFGLKAILEAFPSARAVTEATVVPKAKEQLTPDFQQFWNGMLPDQIPGNLVVPDALDGEVIDLEGHELRIIMVGQSDTFPSTVVHIPSLDAVVTGDVAYNNIHQWFAETDKEKRLAWIASVEKVEALNPKMVVPSHQDPDARDRDPATILASTKAYIHDFEASLAESKSPQELVDKMLALYPERQVAATLWLAAATVFQNGQGPST
jgi:glyoxylase-like metal-dependent hydrolase (beta-lactamase superfamily II)